MELVLLFHLRTLRWCVKDLPARRYPVLALYGNLEPAATPAQVNDLLARASFAQYYVCKSKTVFDSGFHALDSRFHALDSGFLILDPSLSQRN